MNRITIFGEDLIEQAAIDQFNDAMSQPFSMRGALMPDAHKGYSLPIGGVVATDRVVVPSWVGVDIGCGMCAMPTGFRVEDVRGSAEAIHQKILDLIPVGFRHRDVRPTEAAALEPHRYLTPEGLGIYEFKGGDMQLGTLGGGNHFIEVGEGGDGSIWIVIHSGSRGVGHGIAEHYMRMADPEGKMRDGHYGFHGDSPEGQAYLKDMNFCLHFALANRRLMLQQICYAIGEFCDGAAGRERDIINRNHNHCQIRNDEHGNEVFIHRKGATHAEDDMWGVIPGNMRDGSYIVKGLGNPASLWSSSHGAGRMGSRKKARQETSVAEFVEAMDGIVAQVGADTLDENPNAYKAIDLVMEAQRENVLAVHRVRPILNVKG
jgi:tRNA-splicing ligase RtcB